MGFYSNLGYKLIYLPNNFESISSGPRSYPESKPIDNNNKNIRIKIIIIINIFLFIFLTPLRYITYSVYQKIVYLAIF